jgi:hypothetical protein
VYISQNIGNIDQYFFNNNLVKNPKNIYNKIAFVTYDNRPNLDYIKMHNTNIYNYCKKWGCTYYYYDKCTYNTYWCKIYLVLEILKLNIYDYVIWLDSDTIIKKMDVNINDIFSWIYHYFMNIICIQ